MKKTCNGCKAKTKSDRCLLDYACKNGVPQIDCPKPKSWKQFKRIEKERELDNEK